MTYCDFSRETETTVRCRVCGRVVRTSSETVVARCKGDGLAQMPGVVQQAANLSAEYLQWAAAGFPVRSQEKIAAIHAVCRVCPSYVAGRCSKCGCACNGEESITNKIYWATTRCPEGKWPG